jgi:hypothetical protein
MIRRGQVNRLEPIENIGLTPTAGGRKPTQLRSGLPQIMLVEPNDALRSELHASLSRWANVEAHAQFDVARPRIKRGSYRLLVTNLRLGAYNGLYFAYMLPQTARVIVYTDAREPGLAREVHRAGAFYEVAANLPITLFAYLSPTLPPHDRRDPAIADRRGLGRGGRRSWDRHAFSQLH